MIIPVNFVVDGDDVLIASEAGAKVEAARHGDVACIEVDHHDTLEHAGWSVLATGRLRIAGDGDDVAQQTRLRPWALSAPEFLLGLRIELLSGRRLWHPPGGHHVARHR